MNSIVIPSWRFFHNSPDIIKNVMLIADDITLVVPMNGIDQQELMWHTFNMPEAPNAYDSIDEILRLSNDNIIQIENGFQKGNTKEANIRKLYGIPFLQKSNTLADVISLQLNIWKIVKEKEAIILDYENELFKPEGITEHRNFTKSNILKHCHVNMPDLSRLSFDEITLLKQKYEEEVIDAQIFINALSFDLSYKIKNESIEEQSKYIQMYVKDLINPRVQRMLKIIKDNRDNKMRAITRKIIKSTTILFTASNRLEVLAELVKTGVDVNEEFKKEHGTEEGAFLSLMVKSYK